MVVFLLFSLKGGFFNIYNQKDYNLFGGNMKLFKEVFAKHRKTIIFYILLGVIVSFLSVFAVNYLQVVLDSFSNGSLKLSTVIFYGVVLILTSLLCYFDTYPEQKLKHGL